MIVSLLSTEPRGTRGFLHLKNDALLIGSAGRRTLGLEMTFFR
jgi:hypothetical protein